MDGGGPLHDWQQAVALVGSAITRVALTPWDGPLKAFISFWVAIFFGYMLTAPVMAIFGFAEGLRTAVIIANGLVGQGVALFLLHAVQSPKSTMDLLTRLIGAFRGGK